MISKFSYQYFLLVGVFIFCSSISILGQDKLEILNANLELTNPDADAQYLWLYKNEKGQVKLKQKLTTLESDSAQYFQKRNYAKALGNVFINQNDSIEIYSKTAEYFGNQSKSILQGEVALLQDIYTLQTERLEYDLKNKVAIYNTGGELSDTVSTLTSKKGKYFTTTKTAAFSDSVVLVTPERRIETDSLVYDLETKRADFVGPTTIYEEDQVIKTTKGWYNTETGEANFDGNPEIDNDELSFKAESFQYDKTGENGYAKGNIKYIDKKKNIELTSEEATIKNKNDVFAKGNVVIIDKENNLTLKGQEVDRYSEEGSVYARGDVEVLYPDQNLKLDTDSLSYLDNEGFIYAEGRPFVSTIYEEDSVFMVAEKMTAVREIVGTDSIYNFVADKNVKVFKSNLQVIADSAYYNNIDSTLTFFKDPVIWTDSTQMNADTITMYIKNEVIDKVHLSKNGFIVNLVEKGLYNQIKGREIDAFFLDGKIDNLLVTGNAETIYFIQDDDGAFLGIDEMRCGKIRALFEEEQISEIFWLNEPNGTTHPFASANLASFRLDGFQWRESEKPKSKYDLLEAIGRMGSIVEKNKPVSGDQVIFRDMEGVQERTIQKGKPIPEKKTESKPESIIELTPQNENY